jgi:hypothetical protein
MHRHGSLWVPDSVAQRLQRGICCASNGDVLTRDSAQPGGSGELAGEGKWAWKPPAGIGLGTVALSFSLVGIALAGIAATSNASGNQTAGAMYYATQPLTITGGRFYWKRNATDRVVNLKLWSVLTATTGTALTNVDVPVTASNAYTGIFPGAVVLPASTRFMITIWEKSGAEYTGGLHSVGATFDTCVPGLLPAPSMLVGQNLVLVASRVGGANAFPNASPTALGDVFYPVEPLIAAA